MSLLKFLLLELRQRDLQPQLLWSSLLKQPEVGNRMQLQHQLHLEPGETSVCASMRHVQLYRR